MATLYITELSGIVIEQGSVMPIAVHPEVTNQTISLSGSSASSAALNAETRYICLHADAICSFKIGAAPTAVVTANRRPAEFIEYIKVAKGKALIVAGITNT